MDKEEPTLVGVAFLCSRWNVSKQAVYNMISRGELAAENLNAKKQADGDRKRASWRIRMDEVKRWEAARARL
jgi:predicted DNA-binding protein YlxM (UPF0122 family)